jgi:apolipoprotein N-acyltransferase
MASKPDSAALSLVLLIGFATASCFYYGTGLHPHWQLTWIASISLLLIAPSLKRRVVFPLAFLAFAIGALNQWHYLHDLLRVLPFVILLFFIGPSLVFAAGVLFYRSFILRGLPWAAALALPSLWVAYEYLQSLVSVHSTFGNLGYTQLDFLPLIQLTSITGIWSLSFCLFLFSSALAIILNRGIAFRQRRNLALATAAIFTIIFSFGAWRLSNVPDAPTVTVGLVAADTRQNLIATTPQDSIALFQRYADQATALAARGAQIVIIPEHTAIVTDQDAPNIARNVDALFSTTAAVGQSLILIGVDRATPSAHFNESRLYSPTSGLTATYHKHHLLPPVENIFTPGTTRMTFQQPSGLWGLAICKDMDFPLLSRQYGNDGIGLLLVPAWDFNADGWLHGRMAILRGVESGFSIARSAKQGILTVSDDRGRVLAQKQTSAATPFVTLLAEVPVRHAATFYARTGDWFGVLNLALFAGLTALALVRRRSKPS